MRLNYQGPRKEYEVWVRTYEVGSNYVYCASERINE